MHLTPDEQDILRGARGNGPKKAMELLVALGKIYGAKRLIPIKSAQVSGVSYKTIGDAGLEFIADFAKDSKVSVPATLNPAGVDLENWEETGFKREFYEKQKAIIDTYAAMGIDPTCTCTPYFIGNRPSKGDHLAWGESSAVSFANSVLGAWTNREGGPGALAAAIVGKTPEYGLHLDENRKATVVIAIAADVELASTEDFAVLGHLVGGMKRDDSGDGIGTGTGGKVLGADGIPFFTGIERASEEQLKALGAAMAATGSVALYHVEGITPEAGTAILEGHRTSLFIDQVEVTAAMLAAHRESLKNDFIPQLIAIGCPHLSPDELSDLADRLDTIPDERINRHIEFWVHVSRKLRDENPELAQRIGRVGRIIPDTCMVVAPIADARYREMPIALSATNSGKAAKYLVTLGKQQRVRFLDMDAIVAMMSDPDLVPTKPETTGPACVEPTANEVKDVKGGKKEIGVQQGDSAYIEPSSRSMKCRTIGPGAATGTVMRCNGPISFLGDVNLETGVVENPENNHCGKSVAGTVLVFSNGVGSTVGSFVMYSLAKRGVAPVAIVNSQAETIVATGAIIAGIPMVDSIDFHHFKDGETITVNADEGFVSWE